MSLTEIFAVIKAYNRRQEKQLRDDMFLAWNIGRFVGVGVNAPKKYPKWDKVERDLDRSCKKSVEKSRPQTDAEMERRCMALARAFRR